MTDSNEQDNLNSGEKCKNVITCRALSVQTKWLKTAFSLDARHVFPFVGNDYLLMHKVTETLFITHFNAIK